MTIFYLCIILNNETCNNHYQKMKNQTFSPKSLLLSLLMALMLPMTAQAAPVKMGDVDNNGLVNVADVTVLISHILGNECDINIQAADLNIDGTLNVADVTALISAILNSGPQTEVITITANGVSFNMVLVQGGIFMMGCTPDMDPDAFRNEGPVHEVTVWNYYMGQTEVTQELWLAVMGNNPSGFLGDLNCPVEHVTLFECARFVDKLTELTGKVFRLPTEAEWEFAARGGVYSRGFKYAGGDDVMSVAWIIDNLASSTHPVALKLPNELGLYDMSGNVLEWCQDFYSSYDSAPQTNPVGPESGYDNVIRGGSCSLPAQYSRVAYRGMMSPYECSTYLGLRLVMNY